MLARKLIIFVLALCWMSTNMDFKSLPNNRTSNNRQLVLDGVSVFSGIRRVGAFYF